MLFKLSVLLFLSSTIFLIYSILFAIRSLKYFFPRQIYSIFSLPRLHISHPFSPQVCITLLYTDIEDLSWSSLFNLPDLILLFYQSFFKADSLLGPLLHSFSFLADIVFQHSFPIIDISLFVCCFILQATWKIIKSSTLLSPVSPSSLFINML